MKFNEADKLKSKVLFWSNHSVLSQTVLGHVYASYKDAIYAVRREKIFPLQLPFKKVKKWNPNIVPAPLEFQFVGEKTSGIVI